MEIRLNKWQFGAMVAGVTAQTVATIVALRKWRRAEKRANAAEWNSFIRGCTINLQGFQIKEMKKEFEKDKAE